MIIGNANKGFTLLELMIAVAVVGILAAVAIPNYSRYVRQANRADAKTILLENAQFLERNYTENNKYHKDSGGDDISIPVTVSPKTGTALYNISAATLTATTYKLTATPVTGKTMANDECAALSINQLGQKTVSDSATLSADECWRK